MWPELKVSPFSCRLGKGSHFLTCGKNFRILRHSVASFFLCRVSVAIALSQWSSSDNRSGQIDSRIELHLLPPPSPHGIEVNGFNLWWIPPNLAVWASNERQKNCDVCSFLQGRNILRGNDTRVCVFLRASPWILRIFAPLPGNQVVLSCFRWERYRS